MKIPFDIKYRPQIESGEYKLETECGHPASVIDWEWFAHDKKKCLAIKVLKEGGLCAGYLFDYDGKRHSIFTAEEDSGLFLLIPESELTEFEKKVKEIADCKENSSYLGNTIYKSMAAELRAIAFREFKEDEATHMKEFVDHKPKEAYEKGKADALKDLPRWKKHEEASDKLATVWNDFVTPWLDWRGHRIAVRDLEKLPGFKED